MGRLIEFYVPESHKPKIKWADASENGRVIEFPEKKSEAYIPPPWAFAEIDSDLA